MITIYIDFRKFELSVIKNLLERELQREELRRLTLGKMMIESSLEAERLERVINDLPKT